MSAGSTRAGRAGGTDSEVSMTTAAAYRSDHRPDTAPFEESAGTNPGFAYAGTLETEIAAGGIAGANALDLLDAMRAIAAGERIVKYNCPIGSATAPIAPGDYVHTHNVASDYLPTYTLPP